MSDTQERTEKATEKRLREVRSKGQLSRSQDLTAWLAVGAGGLMVPSTITAASNAGAAQLFLVRSVTASPDPGVALRALADAAASLAATLGPLIGVVFVTVLAG